MPVRDPHSALQPVVLGVRRSIAYLSEDFLGGPEQTARLGADSHVGHVAIVHGSKIKENVLVGMGAILHEGVEIGENCIVGSGCVITDNRTIPPRKLVVGVPGKIVGDVSPEMQRAKIAGTRLYQTLPRRYQSTLKQIG